MAATLYDILSTDYVSNALQIGGIGFVAGVILPWGFWLVGSVIQAAGKFLR